MYIDPLVRILEERNPELRCGRPTRWGVFAAHPDQTLILLVDLKSDALQTWPVVWKTLQPLRERNWLSIVRDGQVHLGPVTVVGTGNTNFELLVENSTYRDAFFDAPLDRLLGSPFNQTNSYYSSMSFTRSIGVVRSGELSADQVSMIRRQVKEAHSRGLKVRYWNLPAWPIRVRNYVWDVLVREGVDILNVDDLGGLRREWVKRQHGQE
jgi:hypothetical protein